MTAPCPHRSDDYSCTDCTLAILARIAEEKTRPNWSHDCDGDGSYNWANTASEETCGACRVTRTQDQRLAAFPRRANRSR